MICRYVHAATRRKFGVMYFILQASLPAVLAFNIRRSATKYDQRAKKYKGFSTGGNQCWNNFFFLVPCVAI